MPVLEDLTFSDAPDRDAAYADLLASCGDAEEFARVRPVGRYSPHDLVFLGDQVVDHVVPGRAHHKRHERLLPALTGRWDAGKRVVLHEIRGEEFIDDVCVATLAGNVNRLEVAANEGLVLVR